MSKCPECGSEGVYNSGFTIECINKECRYFSQRQLDIYEEETQGGVEDRGLGYVGDPGIPSGVGYALRFWDYLSFWNVPFPGGPANDSNEEE